MICNECENYEPLEGICEIDGELKRSEMDADECEFFDKWSELND
jgi:hypothetical protein